jgi:quercetin dioxygenase-like cupin family protein
MSSNQIKHYFPDGEDRVYIKKYVLKPHEAIEIHSHTYTHKSVVAAGSGILIKNGMPLMITEGTVVVVPVGVRHVFHALGRGATWLCIHSTDEDTLEPSEMDKTLLAPMNDAYYQQNFTGIN